MRPRIHVRAARPHDLPRLAELQRQFVEGHCGAAWTSEALQEYLDEVGPLHPQRIEDGTLFVAGLGSRIVGFASWSFRERAEGRGLLGLRKPRPLDPATEAARLDAFFVEPDWLQGASERLLRVTEYAAHAHGFGRAALRVCPDGALHFGKLGYEAGEHGELELQSGRRLPVVHLERCLRNAALPVRSAA